MFGFVFGFTNNLSLSLSNVCLLFSHVGCGFGETKKSVVVSAAWQNWLDCIYMQLPLVIQKKKKKKKLCDSHLQMEGSKGLRPNIYTNLFMVHKTTKRHEKMFFVFFFVYTTICCKRACSCSSFCC